MAMWDCFFKSLYMPQFSPKFSYICFKIYFLTDELLKKKLQLLIVVEDTCLI